MRYLALIFCLALLSPALSAQEGIGIVDNAFILCPSSPNCISSMEPKRRKHIDLLYYTVTPEKARACVRDIMTEIGATLEDHNNHWEHYSVQTGIGKFTDDVQFYYPQGQASIHLRSASRVGYGDFGANRRRLKKISKQFYRMLEE